MAQPQLDFGRTGDSGTLEDLLFERGANHVRHSRPVQFRLSGRISFDDYNRECVVAQLAGDHAAETAVATDDNVAFEMADPVLHRRLPYKLAESSFNYRGRDYREDVVSRTDTHEDEDHREDAAVGAERLYFLVADRADGDNRHVDGVERRHALDQNVADGAEGDQDDDGAESEEKPASGHLSERGALHFTRNPSAPNHWSRSHQRCVRLSTVAGLEPAFGVQR